MNVAPGSSAILRELPPGFLDDLPAEDQKFNEIVGKPLKIVGYDEDGRAELEFRDSSDVIHFLYVDAKFLSPA